MGIYQIIIISKSVSSIGICLRLRGSGRGSGAEVMLSPEAMKLKNDAKDYLVVDTIVEFQ